MMRTPLLALACLGLTVGCASSSSNNNVQNPDAGAVEYDSGGDGGAAADQGGDGSQKSAAGRARSSTGVRGVGIKRKGVAKLKTEKPPREPGTATLAPGALGEAGEDSPNGLKADVYALETGTSELPDFSTLEISSSFEVADLDVAAKGTFPGVTDAADTIGIRFTGSFNVVEEGEYNLCLNSAAGSRLALDDTPVVDNDGAHGAEEVCELVGLAPGEYGLAIDFFYQSGEEVVLQFKWARGGDPEPVPTEVLFKPGT